MHALRDAGQSVEDPDVLVDLIFGVGMGASWRSDTEILLDRSRLTPGGLSRRGNGTEHAFFIPAHRSMLISDGWAAPFQKLSSETPVVARIFSQNLFDRFSARGGDELFPLDRVLKKVYRELIDSAVFHGGAVALEQDVQHAKRLKLRHGGAQLPFMTWTAGQREFTPLLLGRGYRVVLSTHSPHVLTAVWMLQRLKALQARWQLVCEGFGIEEPGSLRKVAEAALTKSYFVHVLAFGEDGKVRSRDISNLDPDAEDDGEASWGGLTGFSSRFGEAVRTAVLEHEA